MNVSHELGKVLIIGGGKMGEAVLAALLALPDMKSGNVTVANPGEAKRQHLEQTYSVACVVDAAEAPLANTVILAVKPQVMSKVLAKAVDDGVFSQASLAVSIAAGITTESLEGLIPGSCAVVRVMPNLPLSCGSGAAAVSGGSRASHDQVALVVDVFAAAGGAVQVPESLQGAATAISGNGPAYFALFVDELAKAGAAQGLSYDAAYELALSTMKGTACLLESSGVPASQLVVDVTSPGGTTEAALAAMRAGNIGGVIASGVAAGVRRSEELAAK